MKTIKLSCDLFNIAMKAINNFTSRDDTRPVLKKVKCEVTKSTIEFIALDGFKGIRYIIKHNNNEIEPFEFVFYPFLVDEDKQGINEITIAYTEEKVTITYPDKQRNIIQKAIKNAHEEFINYAQVEKMNTEEQFSISFTISHLLRALQSISKSKADYLTFHLYGKTMPAVITTRENEYGECRSLVLPICEL